MVRRLNAPILFRTAKMRRCGKHGQSFASGGRVSAEHSFAGALRALAAALDEIPALSMIIGGVAVIAAGVPRETIDIDATILGQTSSPEMVLEALARQQIVPRIAD